MDLGPSADQILFECPKPFAPDLFPDLCIGAGGVAPAQTPREAARNRVVSYIFNKLAANIYILAGVPASPGAEAFHQNDENQKQKYKKLFVVVAPDGEEIIFPERLVEKFKLPCRLFTHSSSFGFLLCVRDKLPQGMEEPPRYSADIKHKELYTQIPLAFSSRSGIRNPNTGQCVKAYTVHMGMSIKGSPGTSPLGYFEIHHFLG